WTDGDLSSAQIQAVVANVKDRHVGLFAKHEAALIPTFVPLSVPGTIAAMQEWREQAKAVDDDDKEPPDEVRTAHLSGLMDGAGRLVGGAYLDGTSIRTVLCDAGVHRVVTDGQSGILDFGKATYQAPAVLFNALVLRDGGCRHPGCDRGPEWTEAHHVIPFPHGPT